MTTLTFRLEQLSPDRYRIHSTDRYRLVKLGVAMSCSSTIANMESENGPWWLDVSAKELDGLFYKAARFCNNFVYGDYS